MIREGKASDPPTPTSDCQLFDFKVRVGDYGVCGDLYCLSFKDTSS